ncbi:MAG: hypothetical protein ACK41E_02920 [Deinococcales bacterium]
MKRLLVSLGLVATVVALATGQSVVSSGLLLGLRSGDSYSTVWIAPQNGKLTARKGKDVLVPRKSGWWRVGLATTAQKTLDNELTTIATLWATTIQNKGLGKTSFEADCQETSTDTLLFVHEQYLALENTGSGFCKGAAHPWSVSVLEVRSLDVLGRAGNTKNITNPEPNTLEIGTVLGQNTQKQFIAAGERFYRNLPTEKQEFFEKSPSSTNWAMIRRNGQWVMRGRLGYAYEAVRNVCCIDFDSGINPKSLVGHDQLAVSWANLKAKYPKMIDAFSSPNKDVLFTIEPNKLLAFALQNGKLGGVLLSLPFKDPVSPVMIEWANPGSVARWTKELGSYLK